MQEEGAGKLADARRLIQQGCDSCPSSEDVWLEFARLSKPEDGKAILAQGMGANPTSVRQATCLLLGEVAFYDLGIPACQSMASCNGRLKKFQGKLDGQTQKAEFSA